jgi:hypothetical protein
MKNYKLIFLLMLLTCCQPKKTDNGGQLVELKTLDYELNLNVRPSFSPEVTYRVKMSGHTCSINDIEYRIETEDGLLKWYINELNEVISKNFNRKDYEEDHGSWIDGTPVTITVTLKDSTREFKFDNSGKNSLLNKFVPPIYSIIHYLNESDKSKFKMSGTELSSFEKSEESVIDFPIRKISDNPLKYRLYGRVYYYCYEQVQGLFNDFPKDKITYVEVSPYYTINRNDEFYKIFRGDIVKRENIRWIVNKDNVEEMTSLGIPKKYITIKSK